MAADSRALVLSGGGTAGGGWMLGLISALRDQGIDLGVADLIVGTSAGARAGVALATGTLDRTVAMYRASKLPPLEVPVTLEAFTTAVMAVLAETPVRQEATRRIANLGPLASELASGEDRRRMVAAHLAGEAWPQKHLEVVAVDAETGARATFDASSGVSLLDALTASGALPGIFPLVTIDGSRYADGGLHSPFNADLASGHDVVVVLSPMAPNPMLEGLLNSEIATLGQARVHVIAADETSLAAIGPNPLPSDTASAALEAGAVQAARESEGLAASWRR